MKTNTAFTCPECGAIETVEMPEDQCVIFRQCATCEAGIRPKKGDCCVFCSYGDTPCPPEQKT